MLKEFHSKTELAWKRKDELLQQEIDSILQKYPETHHDDIIATHAWDLHLNQVTYPNIHREALVIAIYAFLENQLNGLCHTLSETITTKLQLTDLSGQGIERAFLYLLKVASFDLPTISSLSFVKDVNKLRNKMIHGGGILPEDPNDRLNAFVRSAESLSGEPGGKVHINSDFIDELIDKLVNFFDEMEKQVQNFISHQNDPMI